MRPKGFEPPAPGVGDLRHPDDRLGSYPDRHEGLFPDRREDEGDSGRLRLPPRRRGERREHGRCDAEVCENGGCS